MMQKQNWNERFTQKGHVDGSKPGLAAVNETSTVRIPALLQWKEQFTQNEDATEALGR